MNENFSLEKQMFNSSAISDFMECPKMFERTWIRRLELKEEKPALVFGSVMHKALLEWYKSGDKEKALKEFEALPDAIADSHITRGWGDGSWRTRISSIRWIT